jgi:hypothetical protein
LSSSAPRGPASMDVDATPAASSGGQSVTASGVAQVVITPYNHSPSTPRGKELVDRARALSPLIIAPIVSPVVSRSSSASRGYVLSCKDELTLSRYYWRLRPRPLFHRHLGCRR